MEKVQRYKIELGDAGVWVTCVRGMEIKAETELRRLFEEVSETTHNHSVSQAYGCTR